MQVVLDLYKKSSLEGEICMTIRYKVCLQCHSKRVANILFGLPTSEVMQQVEQGKVVLGGCMVQIDGPEYECLDCQYQWNRQQAIEAAYQQVTKMTFTVGGFHQGHHEFTIDFEQQTVKYYHALSMKEPLIQRIQDVDREKKTLKMIDILNWKKNYVHPEILDGEQWSLEIVRNGRTYKKHGSNEYPRNWRMFCDWLESLVEQKLFEDK